MRYRFGGVMSAWWVTTADAGNIWGAGVRAIVLSSEAVHLPVFDEPDGAQQTDLIDADGQPTDEIVIPAGRPYIQPVDGPDDMPALWVQASDGTWLPLPRLDLAVPAGLDADGLVPIGQLPVGTGADQIAAGRHSHPHMIRHVGAEEPDTVGWNIGDFWYDTSGEGQ